jgi:hypothetical protein
LRKIADELDGDRAKRHAARMARTRQWAAVTQTVSMLASSGASFVQQEFFKLAETEINYPPMQKPAGTSAVSRRCIFFGQPTKCEIAHTSLPIRPSKVRHSDIYLAPGGVHGTETKTS